MCANTLLIINNLSILFTASWRWHMDASRRRRQSNQPTQACDGEASYLYLLFRSLLESKRIFEIQRIVIREHVWLIRRRHIRINAQELVR
jgi:hypothetical protein